MKMVSFKGAITAMITPFQEDGSVDYGGLRQNIEFQIEQGINGLVPCGTTGESPTLSHEEHGKVIEETVKAVNGRVPVIAGTGSNCTREAVEMTQQAEKVGADAVLVVNPYYNKPTQEGLYRHFRAIATRTKLPVIVYNIKGRTAVNVETSTMERFKEIKNIAGVKEASGDLNQMKSVIEAMGPDFAVLSGDDNMTIDLMKAGGHGVISVVSNIVPKKVSQMTAAALSGDWGAAEKLNSELAPLYKAAFIETNPIPIKTSMRLTGMPSGPFRLPMCDMIPENLESLKATLKEMQIMNTGGK